MVFYFHWNIIGFFSPGPLTIVICFGPRQTRISVTISFISILSVFYNANIDINFMCIKYTFLSFFWLRKYMYIPRSLSLFMLHTNPLCQNIFQHLEITTMKNDNNKSFLYVGYFLYPIPFIFLNRMCNGIFWENMLNILSLSKQWTSVWDLMHLYKQYCSHSKYYQQCHLWPTIDYLIKVIVLIGFAKRHRNYKHFELIKWSNYHWKDFSKSIDAYNSFTKKNLDSCVKSINLQF